LKVTFSEQLVDQNAGATNAANLKLLVENFGFGTAFPGMTMGEANQIDNGSIAIGDVIFTAGNATTGGSIEIDKVSPSFNAVSGS